MYNHFGHSDRDNRAFDRIQVDFEKGKMIMHGFRFHTFYLCQKIPDLKTCEIPSILKSNCK